MKNCLVTKLKSTVNNENLPYLNKVKMHFSPSQTGSIRSFNNTTLVFPDESVVQIGPSTNYKLNTLTDGVDVFYMNKYTAFPIRGNNTINMDGVSFNIEDFAKTDLSEVPIIDFKGGAVYGDISKLQNSNAVKGIIVPSNYNITGELGTIVNKYPNLGDGNESDNTLNLSYTRISGDVAGLGNLNYKPYQINLIGTLVSGNIYDAIVELRGKSNFEDGQGNGQMVRDKMHANSSVHLWSVYPQTNAFTISWTATTSSITINGTTTTFDNSGNILT